MSMILFLIQFAIFISVVFVICLVISILILPFAVFHTVKEIGDDE
jgi:hypothetical protein